MTKVTLDSAKMQMMVKEFREASKKAHKVDLNDIAKYYRKPNYAIDFSYKLLNKPPVELQKLPELKQIVKPSLITRLKRVPSVLKNIFRFIK